MAKLYDGYYSCKKCGKREFVKVQVLHVRINNGEVNVHNPELTREELRCDSCGSKIETD